MHVRAAAVREFIFRGQLSTVKLLVLAVPKAKAGAGGQGRLSHGLREEIDKRGIQGADSLFTRRGGLALLALFPTQNLVSCPPPHLH
jgi:hypothetical protein